MNYEELMTVTEKNFGGFKKPSIVHNAAPEYAEKLSYPLIQADFGNMLREEMSSEDCISMIHDGPLISDEAWCYFLPRLAKAVLYEGADAMLFYLRLEKIKDKLPAKEQREVVSALINAAKQIEKDFDDEFEKENAQWRTDSNSN